MLQIIIIVLAIAADQVSKFLLTPMLDKLPNDSMAVIPDVFHLTFVKNQGASFGMLQGFQGFFIVVTVVVIVVATWFMIKYRKKHSRFFKVSLALVYAGAVGNLIDRIAYGYVRDFIDLRMFDFWKWIFNVADACLVIGSIMLGIYILFLHKDKPRQKGSEVEPAPNANGDEPSDKGEELQKEEPEKEEEKPEDGG